MLADTLGSTEWYFGENPGLGTTLEDFDLKDWEMDLVISISFKNIAVCIYI